MRPYSLIHRLNASGWGGLRSQAKPSRNRLTTTAATAGASASYFERVKVSLYLKLLNILV